jgi:hypothetical protein
MSVSWLRLRSFSAALALVTACGRSDSNAPAQSAGGGGEHAAVMSSGEAGVKAAASASGVAGQRASAADGGRGPRRADVGNTAGTPAAISGGASGALAGSGDSGSYVTIANGGAWRDSSGKRIEAHGAGVLFAQGAWYWFGEDKSANSANFKAVNCYRSTDLAHWEFRRAVITRQTSSELAASDRIIERPKVIYNDATQTYVMWVHWEGMSYATAEAGVFKSSSIDGDYTQVRHLRPNDNMSRDDTLFKDDDGKAYFLSAANNNADSALYQLTDDYTDIARQVATLWPGSSREAPAIMKSGGTYFIVNSAATSWDPNQQKYASATSIEGPWSALANLGDATGFDTQTAFIIPVHGSKATTFIYAGDRWQDPDLVGSKYIWLPLQVHGDKLALDYYASWELDANSGEWRAADGGEGFLARDHWQLVSADSEETQAEDGHATNAFDGSPSTFWHTQWQDAQPPPPHELVIDLGARYALTRFRYTPRNDGNQNGMIKDYELYVSDSTTDFGNAIKSGSFGSTSTPTTVDIPETTGRYVRFRGLSELNGKAYSCVAELDFAGMPK